MGTEERSVMPPPKETGRKWGTRFSDQSRLLLVAILSLVIGIEIGFVLKEGGFQFLWDLASGRDDLGAFAGFVLAAIAVVLLIPLACTVGRRIPERWYWIAGGVLVLLSIPSLQADESMEYLLGVWYCVFAVITIASAPAWLSIFCFFFVGSASVAFVGSPMTLYLVGIVLIGLWRYPTGISIRRFLIPRRGVL